MKTIKIIITVCLFLSLSGLQAKVVTVDNNPGAPNDGVHNFNSITAAYNATISGDTIYVQDLPLSYGDVTFNSHQITIIGPGINPGNGKLSATLGTLSIDAQATNGSHYVALNLNTISLMSVSNFITFSVERCKFSGDIHNYGCCDMRISCSVHGCVFTNTGSNITITYPSTGISISDNIFNGYVSISDNYQTAFDNNTISNNIFLGTTDAIHSLASSVVSNNIFYRSSPNSGITNSTFSNNIIFQCSGSNAIPVGSNGNTGANNYQGIDPGFGGGFPLAGDLYNAAYDFHPTNATALTGGAGGNAIGVYDASGTFTSTGEPSIPRVIDITPVSTTSIPQNGTLQLQVVSKRIK